MRIQIAIMAAIALLCGQAFASGVYKWTDANGVVHYTDTPPPAAAQGGKSGTVQQLNSQGVVTHRTEAVTPERTADIARQKEEDAKLVEQRRRDNALLKSFTKPSEVDLLRDRTLEGIDGEIKTSQLRKQLLEKHINEGNLRIGKLEKAKKPLPDDLVQQVKHDEDELKRVDDLIANRQKAKDGVKQKAADDKQRLIELQGSK